MGGGSIGTVYKITFEGVVSIAVKKLETLGGRNQDQFEQVIGRLGNLHHPDLVAFQGYYWSIQLILSEFVTNGSLYHHLHEDSYSGSSSGISRSNLHWSRRFRIAFGTAKALAHLNHDCKSQVLHLNIKSSNIILDEEFEPRFFDYGLGKLLPIFGNNALTKFHTSVGYVAPELASQGLRLRYGDKCDVYSYGVILLELVTGRKPVESPASRRVVILCDYVRDLLEKGSASDCLDRRLREFAEIELIQIMKLGLVCASEAPLERDQAWLRLSRFLNQTQFRLAIGTRPEDLQRDAKEDFSVVGFVDDNLNIGNDASSMSHSKNSLSFCFLFIDSFCSHRIFHYRYFYSSQLHIIL